MAKQMRHYLKKLKDNKKGFTLIELIVVIAIIGILAAMLVPSMSGYLQEAKSTKRTANARTFYSAAQAAVTAVEASGAEVANQVITNEAGEADSVNKAVQDKLVELVGVNNLAKFESYTISIDAYGAVTVAVTEDGVETTFPEE